MSLLVFGALHHDVVVRAPRFPVPGETLIGSDVAYVFGGKGGNQAVAAAHAGAAVAMAGRVGRDAAGQFMLATLDRAGVDRTRVVLSDGSTGMSVAIVDETGENAAVVVSGVNRVNTGADVDLSDDVSTVLVQNEIPMSANIALVSRLPAQVRLIVNAAPAGPLPDKLLARTDVLIVNQIEAQMLTGGGTPGDMATALRLAGPEVVIVTLGGDGLICVGPDGQTALPAPPVAVHSTHGAGDVFCGAFAANLEAGFSLADALDYAQRAAARKVAGP